MRSVCVPGFVAAENTQIRALLASDPVWAAYAIADLRPDYAPHCSWQVAEGEAGLGLLMLFSRLSPPALFAMGNVTAVAIAIREADLPDELYMTLLEEHHAVAGRWYDFSSDIRPMYRMRLADSEAALRKAELPAKFDVRALGADDGERIRCLLAHGGEFAPDAFDAYQAADGTFFVAADANGELLAVGGTHVVDWQEGIAAVGNMYTHPAHRGEGLGSAVLQAIVKRLLDGGATHIVLNVDERNPVARRLYEQHGFEFHCRYLEGRGRRMDPK